MNHSRRTFMRWAVVGTSVSRVLFGSRIVRAATPQGVHRNLDLETATRLGFSESGLMNIEQVFREMLERGEHPGAQLAIYRNGERVLELCGGVTDGEGSPVNPQTLYQMRSTTKALTTMVMMQAYERGRFEFDDPVAQHWPEFALHGKSKITIAQVLSHQAGIPTHPNLSRADMNDPEAIAKAVADTRPVWEPGTANGYHASNIGWICDVLLWRWERRRVSDLLAEGILRPVGAKELYLGLPAELYPRMAKMVVEDEVRQSQQARADFSDFINTPEGIGLPLSWVGGIANASSLARVMCIPAHEGTFEGHTYYKKETQRIVSTPRNPADRVDLSLRVPLRWGLGFILGDGEINIYGHKPRPRAIGHAGGGASYAWADPDQQLAVAFLCNRMRGPGSWKRYTRLGDAVYASFS